MGSDRTTLERPHGRTQVLMQAGCGGTRDGFAPARDTAMGAQGNGSQEQRDLGDEVPSAPPLFDFGL